MFIVDFVHVCTYTQAMESYYEDQKGDFSQGLMAEPEYSCAAGCGYTAWTPSEMAACITCSRRFCADCLIAIGPEKYCPACALCACGKPAIESCMECGVVLCDGCIGDGEFCKECQGKAVRA